MINKKNFVIFSLVLSGLFINCSFVFAVRMVPKLNPLQPMPQDATPNVTENINTKDSQINKNQQIEQSQIETNGINNSNLEKNIKTGDNNLTKTPTPEIPIHSAGYYWALIVFGLIGLVISGLLIYRMFWSR